MILDIFSETLSSHIKSESYNADYCSKDLIIFCKYETHKIYKHFFAKFTSCTLKKYICYYNLTYCSNRGEF